MPVSTSSKAQSAIELAVGVVAAYVSNNPVPVSELPSLIWRVHSRIANLANGGETEKTDLPDDGVQRPSPAQIRRSVQHDGLVSFIDGKTYKTLKRHLTSHGLDPRSYRARYGLPGDYPMVAPAYAEKRSVLAKAIGLGRPGAMAMRNFDNDRKIA